MRQYARIVRENALLRRLLRATYEIQARSTTTTAAARPRRQAERAILEVGHDDRRKDFRAVSEVLHEELDRWTSSPPRASR